MSRGQMCVSGKLHVHGRTCQLGKAAVDSFFATLLYEVFGWVRRRKLRGKLPGQDVCFTFPRFH